MDSVCSGGGGGGDHKTNLFYIIIITLIMHTLKTGIRDIIMGAHK